jgi:hypothetical protein
VTAVYLICGITMTRLSLVIWASLFPANLLVGFLFFQFMRRFNLVHHEWRSWGVHGMALELITAPIYVAAAVAQLAGRRLTYVVTAKGSAVTRDTVRTFRGHLGWAVFAAGCMAAGLTAGHDYPTLYVWAGFTLLVSITPVLILAGTRLKAMTVRDPVKLPAPLILLANRHLGGILVERGLITAVQLRELLDLQATEDRPWQRLGEVAIEHDYITADQVADALQHQAHNELTTPVRQAA